MAYHDRAKESRSAPRGRSVFLCPGLRVTTRVTSWRVSPEKLAGDDQGDELAGDFLAGDDQGDELLDEMQRHHSIRPCAYRRCQAG